MIDDGVVYRGNFNSYCLFNNRSGVQIPFYHNLLAQLIEQRFPKPKVTGLSPVGVNLYHDFIYFSNFFIIFYIC